MACAFLLASLTHAQEAVRGGALPQPNPLFPPDNWWNQDISQAPIDPASASFMSFVGGSRGLHPDFGGDAEADPEIYGMVYVTVPGSQPLVPVLFDYDDESDAGAPGRSRGYPIPVQAQQESRWIEGGYPGDAGAPGDKHLLIVDRDHRLLFETWNTRFDTVLGVWRAGSGAVFSLDSNQRRPETWTSADAAGLAVLPGLVRYDEVYGSEPIRHAFRVTVRATNGYVYPASHAAGSTSGALPMGARLRLRASKDLAGFPPEVRKIFQAMKTYGLIVADNGSDLYVQGAYDPRWDNDVLNPAFAQLKGNDFELVQRGWQPNFDSSPAPLGLHGMSPCRLLDTRNLSGPAGGPPLAAGQQRVVRVAGHCGIPLSARAVVANLTVVSPTGSGHLSVFPGDETSVAVSSLNFSAGQIRANNGLFKLAASGSGTLTIENGATSGRSHILLDVNGWFE